MEHHKREMEKCRKRVTTASSQPLMSTAVIQRLVNELKSHETAYQNAQQNLQSARGGTTNNRRQAPQRTTSSTQTRSARINMDDLFASYNSHPMFQTSFQPGQRSGAFYASTWNGQRDPLEAQFAAFNNAFAGLFGPTSQTGFAQIPNATFTFNSRPTAHTRSFTSPGPQFPSFTSGSTPGSAAPRPQPAPPPKPPKNLLQPAEAKRLFKTYNDRWLALAPADPSIPYPSRGHRPAALCVRDSIWAPAVDSPISTWSEELVMQANAQAFFLGVVGLSPTYTESAGTGKLNMGYNRTKASAAQTKELIDMLKKEKMRWHSDRLGRRTGGLASAGPNEALQTDERARAVFHAVCELMNVAQGA